MERLSLTGLPRAVVFDMDGLLFDTEALYFEATVSAGADFGLAIDRPFFLSTVGLAGHATHRRYCEHFGDATDVDGLLADIHVRFRELARTELRLKPGVLELLDHLDGLGLPRAIATSSGPAEVEHHLAAFDLRDRFAAVVARGDYAEGKPAPDPFLRAAERLAVAPDACLALEDSHNGVRAAAAAGMAVVMVPDLLEPTAEIRALCHAVADDLHQVRALLTRPDAPQGR